RTLETVRRGGRPTGLTMSGRWTRPSGGGDAWRDCPGNRSGKGAWHSRGREHKLGGRVIRLAQGYIRAFCITRGKPVYNQDPATKFRVGSLLLVDWGWIAV